MDYETRRYLQSLAIEVDAILQDELSRSGLDYDFAEARILNIRTVGVQGDDKTYLYPAEINVRKNGRVVWDPDFIASVSSRITNNVRGVNRVVYVLEKSGGYK